MIAETMLPAAPVTRTTLSGPSVSASGSRLALRRERPLDEPDAPAQAVDVPDLDATGVAQRLVDQELAPAARSSG